MSSKVAAQLRNDAERSESQSEKGLHDQLIGPELPKSPPHALPDQLFVTSARPGDHAAIHHFLQSIFHGPSAVEFQAQLDDPFYEPHDRLVVKQGERVVSHVHLTNREISFGELTLPVSWLSDLATLPEFHGQGCATALLEAADRKMIQESAVLGLLQTRNAPFYLHHGWTVCGRHCFSFAQPRKILSDLNVKGCSLPSEQEGHLSKLLRLDTEPRKLNIRLWRHVERAALIRLYEQNLVGTYGRTIRSEAYWRWLISRRGYDRIYVAIDGPNKLELDDTMSPIVGYAAMKEDQIVELMTSPGHPTAPAELLARACSDAIERDCHSVRFDGPAGHPLHELIESAGGKHSHHEAESGDVFLVKLFDPLAFAGMIAPMILQRAKAASLPRPCELGLLVDDQKLRLLVSQRRVQFLPGKLGRSYIKCSRAQFVQLLLGHLRVDQAVEDGRLQTSTRVAIEMASLLLPHLPLWHPPLDQLPA